MPTSTPDRAKTRVLIVDDAEQVRQTIRAMLDLYDGFEVVGEAADGEAAIEAVTALKPDVVLMDINLPALDGISATGRIVRESGTAVVMISVENGQEYFRRAMKAGAKDFLVKPFSSDSLAEAIRRAAREAPRPRDDGQDGRVVTVFGAKGGVGVSTVAVNLALALARGADRVAVVDLDLEFGGLEVLLDVNPRVTLADVCREGAVDDVDLLEAAMTHVSGFPLWLLAAPLEPHLAAVVDGEARPDPSRQYVADAIRALRRRFRYVVVDGGKGFREAHIQALEAADVVLFVTTPDVPSLAASARALRAIEALGAGGERLRLLVNRADEAVGLTVDDMARALGRAVDYTLPAERAATLAANTGQPLAARRTRSRLAESIFDVAGAVNGDGGRDRAAGGWRLFGRVR